LNGGNMRSFTSAGTCRFCETVIRNGQLFQRQNSLRGADGGASWGRVGSTSTTQRLWMLTV
jgi:hypothetical protein